MNVEELLEYLSQQEQAVQAVVKQLGEIQVVFNGQYDQFKAKHDAALARVTELVAERLAQADGPVPQPVRAATEARLADERQKIASRRQDVADKYLPDRQRAASALLEEAQAELGRLRSLNPQLDEREEALKKQKTELEARLAALNDQIRSQSRGLGVVTHFVSLLKADQERQRIIGQLEIIVHSLLQVRREWEMTQSEATAHQGELKNKWQLESIAVARLQAELAQLGDAERAEALALRRAIYGTLDELAECPPSPEAELQTGLEEVITLNQQTDAYHAGLGAVGGLIGLLGGIGNGLGALKESVQGLKREQEMHSTYLKPLKFQLAPDVQEFHKQWPALKRRFADEETAGAHPAEFAAAVAPLVEQTLSQARIEAVFTSMGTMLQAATRDWQGK